MSLGTSLNAARLGEILSRQEQLTVAGGQTAVQRSLTGLDLKLHLPNRRNEVARDQLSDYHIPETWKIEVTARSLLFGEQKPFSQALVKVNEMLADQEFFLIPIPEEFSPDKLAAKLVQKVESAEALGNLCFKYEICVPVLGNYRSVVRAIPLRLLYSPERLREILDLCS